MIVNTQSDPFKYSSFRSSEPVLPGLESPKGVTMIVGGTNVRFVISESFEIEPISFSLSWPELAKKLKISTAKLYDKTDEALDFLAIWFVKECQKNAIRLETIEHFGLSFAGKVKGNGDNSTVTTVNAGIRIDNLDLLKLFVDKTHKISMGLGEEFEQESIGAHNDAVASILGERIHPLGLARNISNAIFIIVGTGIGGAGITNDLIDESISEFGHTWIRREESTGKSSLHYIPYDQLVAEGYVIEGKYNKLKDPMESYIETFLAGPAFAIRFAFKIKDEYGLVKRLAIEILKSEITLKESAQINEKDLNTLIEEIKQLGEFNPSKRVLWGTDAKSSAVKRIGKFLVNLTPADYDEAIDMEMSLDPNGDLKKAQLIKIAWDYRRHYLRRLGRFFGAIGNKDEWRDHLIILGGGVIEAFAACPNAYYDIKRLKDHSGLGDRLVISKLKPEDREAAFVTEKLKYD